LIVPVWRLSRLALHTAYGVATAALVLPWINDERREHLIRNWSAHILHILNVRVEVDGMLPTADPRPAMFVANHISWLDIWAINSVRVVRFVAKSEVRDWPVIGWLSDKAGVIFIERARRHDTARVSNAGAQALLDGDSLCVFPEGTTTDGTHVRPFRSSLLQSAVEACAPVWPVALHYPDENGQANIGVAYAGDTTMLQSLRAVLMQRSMTVRLTFAEPIEPEGRDRRALAQAAESIISSLARLPVRVVPETPAGPPAGSR
jgi:1-acyl-sn-glycerol-3-phosphate acyltransferase